MFHFPDFTSTLPWRLQRSCLICDEIVTNSAFKFFSRMVGKILTKNIHHDCRSYFGIMSGVYRSLLGYTDINSSEKLNEGQSLRVSAVIRLEDQVVSFII